MNEKNIRLVTAESVRAGHPDKFCDQIADAILDAHLAHDPAARVAVEVFATEGKMIIGGGRPAGGLNRILSWRWLIRWLLGRTESWISVSETG